MLAVFRVEGNASIGLGHLMRCQALAQTLEVYDIQSVFVVGPATAELARQRHDWVGRLLLVDEYSNEIDFVERALSGQPESFLVLDGYQFSSDYRRQLKSMTSLLVMFDDNNDSGRLYADLVINGSDAAPDLNYEVSEPQACLCLGSGYRVLRREFVEPVMPDWDTRSGLLIAMGGSDVANLTLPILQHLEATHFEAPIRVLTGAAYPCLDKLQAFLKKTELAVQHIHDCQNVADMLVQARMAISAAGSTQFELLACHTPSVLVTVADNQLAASAKAADQGWCAVWDARSATPLQELLEQVMACWQDDSRLQTMHLCAAKIADTRGADRVVEAIVNKLRKESL